MGGFLRFLTGFFFLISFQSALAQADIVVVTTDNQTGYTPNSWVHYNITVSNNGPNAATALQVTLPLQAGISNYSWTASTGVSGTQIPLNVTMPTLNVGNSLNIALEMFIPASFVGNLIVAPVVTSATTDPTPACQCTDADVAQTDVSVTLQNNQVVYTSGGTATYVLTVTNNGPNNTDAVVVNCPLPTGISTMTWVNNIGGSGTGAINNPIALLAPQQTVTYTITVPVPTTFSQVLTLTATASNDASETNIADNQATDTDNPQANVNIEVTNVTSLYSPGSVTTFQVKVTNTGPSAAQNVLVTAQIAPIFTNYSWSGNSTSGTNSPLSNTIATLANGQTITYSISITVPNIFTSPITVSANASSPTFDPDTSCINCSYTIQAKFTDISVVLSNQQSNYVPGTIVNYTLVVSNIGTNSSSGVTVNCPIPAGISDFSWIRTNYAVTTNASGTNIPISNNLLASIPAGESVTYIITLKIPSGFTGNLVCAATATTTNDVNAPNNTATDTDVFSLYADVEVFITNNQLIFTPGQTSVYNVKVVNHGPLPASNINVFSAIPAGATNYSWSVQYVDSSGVLQPPTTSSNVPLNTTIPFLASGESKTFTITLTIPTTQTNPFAVNVAVTANSNDPTLTNNLATDTDLQTYTADVELVNTDYSQYYTPNSQKVYIITVRNNGPDLASGVVITNPIPAGITQFTWTGSNGTSGTNALNTAIPFLAVNQVITYTINLTIPAGFTGNLTNQSSITTASTDPNPGCTQCVDIDLPIADVDVSISDGNSTYTPGSLINYTVTVKNNGPGNADNIQLSNVLTAGVSLVSWTGNATSGTTVFNPLIATMTNGQIITYTLQVQVPTTYLTNLSHAVSVTSSTYDPNTVCTNCVDVDTKKQLADIDLTINDNQSGYIPNTIHTYTVKVINNGPDSASNVAVTIPLPAGISSYTWSGNGASGISALNNTIANLSVGQTVEYVVNLLVPATYINPLTVSGSATSSTITDPNLLCTACSDTDTLIVVSASDADLEITNTDSFSYYSNGNIQVYTVTVKNLGPATATNVQVSNLIPAGISTMSWTGSNGSSGTNTNLADFIPTLIIGQSVVYTLMVTVPPAFSGLLTSTTTVTSQSNDPQPECPKCTDIDYPIADLQLNLSDGVTTYSQGGSTTYTLTIKNNGPSNAINVQVNYPIPQGVSQFNWSGPNNTGNNVPLNISIPTMAVGETLVYTINAQLFANFSSALLSQVTYTSSSNDPTPYCAQCSDVNTMLVPVSINADLSYQITDNSPTYTAGESIRYIVTVTNKGPATAQNINVSQTMVNTIPASWIVWYGNGITNGTGPLNNTIPSLAPGSTIQYQVVVYVPSDFDQANVVSTSIQVTSTTPDPTPNCASCTDVDFPAPKANLKIKKDNGKSKFTNNTDTKYTITITNDGPSDAINVRVSDPVPINILPTNMTWTSSLGTFGTGDIDDIIQRIGVRQTVTYLISLHIPEFYSFTQTPYISSNNTVNLVNTVTVTSSTTDPSPSCPECTDTDTPNPDFVTIDVSPTNYSALKLVTDVLINNRDCASVSNVSCSVLYNGANPTTTEAGIGYFNRNNAIDSAFPIQDGIIIRCGNPKFTEGKYTNTNISSTGSNKPANSDNDLSAFMITSDNLTGKNFDASFIKFDFKPKGTKISFNFLFASNEYGQYQCAYGDTFAFILKDLTTNTTQNLAVIPNTNIPVSVVNVKDNTFNQPGTCTVVPPSQSELFDRYNVPPGQAATSAINMRGQTVKMTASANVNPAHNYSIKLVIADKSDTAFDSTVFIEAGSFKMDDAEELPDYTFTVPGTGLCYNDTCSLNIGLDPTVYSFQWYLNNILIPGQTAPIYTVPSLASGMYTVTYGVTGTNCKNQQSVNVQYDAPIIPSSNAPVDLYSCSNLFDFTPNTSLLFNNLNPNNYTYNYYTSLQAAEDNNDGLAIQNPSAFTGTDGQTIYVRVNSQNSQPYIISQQECNTILTFNLHIKPSPITNTSLSTISACQNDTTLPTITYQSSNGPGPFTYNYVIAGVPYIYTSIDIDNSLVITVPTTTAGPYTVNLVSVRGSNGCTTINNQTQTVQIIQLPTATISGTTNVNLNATSPILTFTGTQGNPPYTFNYTINNGPLQSVASSNLSSTATVSVPTDTLGNFTYQLVSVSSNNCNQSATDSALVRVVNNQPFADIAGATSVCKGSPATQLTFTGQNGTAPFTIGYTINGGTVQTVTTDLSSIVTISIPSTTAGNFQVVIVSVADGVYSNTSAPIATHNLRVIDLPSATVASSVAAVCKLDTNSPIVTFTGSGGVEPYTFSYLANGVPQTINSVAGSAAILTVPTATPGTFTYELTRVESTTSPVCGQNLTTSTQVTVLDLPTAAISGSATICANSSTTISFNGTPNATVNYLVNGNPASILLNNTGLAQLNTNTLSANTLYSLQNVASSSTPVCSQTIVGTANVQVISLPTASVSATSFICSGSTSTITFTGTPNAVVTYLDATNTSRTVTLDGLGSAQVTSPVLTADATYSLVSIELVNPTSTCSANLTG
ncbi:MAG: hypothetical protein CFE24_11540, partial [Flavobacterium sp. BFFFF2]